MLCQRCSRLLQASRPQATSTQAYQKALASYVSSPSRREYSAKTTILPTPRRYPRGQLPTARRFAFHTSNSLSRPPAETPAEPATPPSSSSSSSSSSASPTKLEKPDFLDDAESLIWDRLVGEFSPVELLVQDISGGCGSMYGIEISSEKFRGATMLKQQRMVNAVLGDLMKGWHGVQLKTRVP